MTYRDVLRCELARRDFWEYCKLLAPDFYKEDRKFLKDKCREYQEFYESTDEYLIDNEPPRHGKSRTATLFVQWVIGKCPKDKIITGSYNETLSTVFSKGVRNKIQETSADGRIVYNDIFPHVKVKHGDGAANLWGIEGNDTNTYLATSPTGTATGFGADLMLIDDLIKNEYEARNDNVKEQHWKWFCFVGDTPIATKDGYKKIQDIQNGDKVLTFNHSKCIIEEKEVVRIDSKKSPIYRLEFEDGKVVETTGNHHFYTNRGYISVEEILRSMRCSIEEGQTVLFKGLRRESKRGQAPENKVFELWERNQNGESKQTEEILFYRMQERNEVEELEPEICKMAKNKSRNKGGAWSMHKMRGNGEFARSPYRPRHKEQRCGELDCSLPILPYKISQITRLPRDDVRTVYDIEVKDNHNFFANGILVHNCDTMLSRREGKRKVIVVMTRWASDDLAGRLIEALDRQGKKYRLICYKAFDGRSMLCEDILSRSQYEDILQGDTGKDIVEANYNQSPIDITGRLYSQLQTYDELPKNIESIDSYTDTADEGSDFLCSIIYAVKDCKAYVLEVIYTQDGMEVTEDLVAKAHTDYSVNRAKIESNNGGKGFARNVKRIAQEKYGNNITHFFTFTQTKNKNSRILTGSTGVMNNVLFPVGWENHWRDYWRDMTKYQRIGKNAHDDAQDATTGVYENLPKKKATSNYTPIFM